jgi:hypothetical protein
MMRPITEEARWQQVAARERVQVALRSGLAGNRVLPGWREDQFQSSQPIAVRRQEMGRAMQARRTPAADPGLSPGNPAWRKGTAFPAPEANVDDPESFSRAGRYRRAVPRTPPQEPVMQCVIEIDGRAIHEPSDLSLKGQVALEFVLFGEEWMHASESGPPQAYTTEFEFLAALQEGLHGSPMVLLRRLGLTCSLLVLEVLALDELEAVLVYERSTQENSVIRLKALNSLARHGIRCEADLTFADDFLMNCGVCREPVFASMTLTDRVAVYELLHDAWSGAEQDPMMQREASAFGVTLAQSPQEFVDYYRFFMALVGEQHASPQHAARRGRFAEAAVEALTPALMSRLQCPIFDSPPSAQELPGRLREWCSHGNGLGFSTLASALAYVARHARLNGATGCAALQLIEAHLQSEHRVWLEMGPTSVRYRQDGKGAEYGYDLQDGYRSLNLSAGGSLTIGECKKPGRTSAGRGPMDGARP